MVIEKYLSETEQKLREHEDSGDIVDFYFQQWHRDFDAHRIQYYGYLTEAVRNFLVPKANIPDGHIVELGTNRGELFLELCSHFEPGRCIGYDLENPLELPNIKVMDVRELDEQHDIPIALSINDIGSWILTPESRMAAFKWAKRNTVTGGYLVESRSALVPVGELGDFDCFADLLASNFEEVFVSGNWHVFQKRL